MNSKKPNPSEKTSNLLRNFLATLAVNLPNIDKKLRSTSISTHLLTLAIVSFDKSDPNYDDERIIPYREYIIRNKEDEKKVEKICQKLLQILESDTHLKKCCNGIRNFAYILDEYFLKQIYQFKSLGLSPNKAQIDILYEELISVIYEDSYSRNVYFHLYNFESEDKEHKYEDIQIKQLDDIFIPKLLGEETPISKFHFSETGNYFIKYSDEDSGDDDIKWVNEKYEKAQQVLTLLRLLQDEIIDIDYYSVYFTPHFVNKIRLPNIPYFGDINKTIRSNKYIFSNEEKATLINYHNMQKKYSKRILGASKNSLGKVLQLAQRHFANYHSKQLKDEQFIDLIIAIDALYSPEDKIELSHRIRQNAAIFIGEDNTRKDIYEFMGKIVKKRGKLVHGAYDINKLVSETFIADLELNKLASIVRKSILGFTTIYLRGENSREKVHNRIQESVFNSKEAKKLKKYSDPELFITETFREDEITKKISFKK